MATGSIGLTRKHTMCKHIGFGLVYIVYTLIILVSGVDASHLIVLLENVPYNANFTILCSEVVDLYYNSTPGSIEGYCNSSMELRYNHMEVAEVSFLNASQPYAIPMDVYPSQLNTRLGDSGFFDLWPGGKVKLVANHIQLDMEVLIVMSSLMAVTTIYICTMCYLTTCSSPFMNRRGQGYASVVPAQ